MFCRSDELYDQTTNLNRGFQLSAFLINSVLMFLLFGLMLVSRGVFCELIVVGKTVESYRMALEGEISR